MFKYSLKSLPNISKWDTKNLKDIGFMFARCFNLCSLPDISIWETEQIFNSGSLIKGCTLLKSSEVIENCFKNFGNNMDI